MSTPAIGILGGRGFVGSALARECTRRRWDHVVIDRQNYRDFAGSHFRLLVNANGNSRKYLAEKDPVAEFDASVRSVRASLVDFPTDAYVMISSCDVYPDCSSPEVTHEDVFLDASRQSPYGFHKYLAEQCVRHAARRYLIIRAGGFVGPGLKKNAIYDVLTGHDLWVDPCSALQFMHTDAFAAVLMDLVGHDHWQQTFNLCGQGVVTVAEVARLAGREPKAHAGSPRIRYDVSIAKVSQFVDVPETYASVAKFLREEAARL